MRVAKILDSTLTDKHGKYAEVLGLIDSPSGVQARLKFGDDHRTTASVSLPVPPLPIAGIISPSAAYLHSQAC